MKRFYVLILIISFILVSGLPKYLSAGEKPLNGQYGVLVLVDGTVVDGTIIRTQAGFHVDVRGGQRVVPTKDVALYVKTKQDAYEKISKQSSTTNVPVRLQLAEWCLKNRLYKEAGQEIKSILVLEDDNAVAKELLKQLEEKIDPENAIHKQDLSITTHPMKRDVDFLGGLSRSLAKDYSSKIQPILMNRCGSRSCHGTDEREFSLHPQSLKFKQYSDDNLESVFGQIHWSQPDQSPLLVHHANNMVEGEKIFQGRSGDKQKEWLVEWIRQVAVYRANNKDFHPVENNQISQAGFEKTGQENGMTRQGEVNLTGPPKVTDDEVLKETLELERPDPFSPDEFNRKYHNIRE